jgi:hypothetical protein
MIRMKIRCEVCGNLGQLQHIGKSYYRVKHYLGSVDGKLRFEYLKQSLGYIKGLQGNPDNTRKIDPIDQKTIDPKLKSDASESVNQCGRSLAWLGHRPPTPTTRVQRVEN